MNWQSIMALNLAINILPLVTDPRLLNLFKHCRNKRAPSNFDVIKHLAIDGDTLGQTGNSLSCVGKLNWPL